MSDKPTIAEQYIRASNSGHLVVDPDKKTDADLLLAAGYASSGNRRSMLALRFYRLKANDDISAIPELSSIAGHWLLRRSMRSGRKKLKGIEARDLATRAMIWWMKPVCKPCHGHGHPLMPNSPVINYGHDCPVCHGTGQYPIHRVVPPGTSDEARWLIDQLDSMCHLIFTDMAKLLRPSLDL
jgi:hypothetical protein